jgi:cephalosporin hydroxylase
MTDKGTIHSYLQNFYEPNFRKYKDRENVIVEIGVFHGGSIMMYHEYFTKSDIYGIDVQVYNDAFVNWCGDKSNIFYIMGDAYSDVGIATLPNIDILIDDGPHSMESQLMCLKKYLPKMNRGGMLVIEDIQDDQTMKLLVDNTPYELKEHMYTLDFRFDRGRYDDRMFVIKIPE